MPKQTCFFQFQATASASNAATIDVVEDATIIAMDWSIVPVAGTPANGDFLEVQLSTNTSFLSTNDSNGILGQCGAGFGVLTSGSNGSVQKVSTPLNLKIKRGERLALHTTESGGTTWNVKLILHIK